MKKIYLFLFGFFSLLSLANAQTYCGGGPGTFNGEYISRVQFDNQWNHTSLGSSYTDNTGNASLKAVVLKGSSYNITVAVNTNNYDHHVRVYFDWNDDGDFVDAGENFNFGIYNGNPQTKTQSITVPTGAVNGLTRMRVQTKYNTAPSGPCDATGNGEWEDYAVEICDGTNMKVDNINVTQASTTPVGTGDVNQVIIGFNVVTSGCANKTVVKSATFGNASSTNLPNDATNARLYYTGPTATFNTNTPVGSAATPGSSFTINNIGASVAGLFEGNNWFWLTYDIKAGATPDNVVDASLTSIVVDNDNAVNNVTKTPANGNPAGTRLVVNNYCTPSPANQDGAHIAQIRIDDFQSNNAGWVAGGYLTQFKSQGSRFELCANSTYTLSVDYVATVAYVGATNPIFITAYFDWNRDGDYNDPNEHYFLGDDVTASLIQNTTGTATINFRAPKDAKPGLTGMRVVVAADLTQNACLGTVDGETEEYGFTVKNIGQLEATGDPFICKVDSVDLNVLNPPASFDFENSTDGTNWQNVPGFANQSSVNTSALTGTNYYRIKATDADCPSGNIFSNTLDIPFVGLKDVDADKTEICLGDSALLEMQYDFKYRSYASAASTALPADEVTRIPIVVAGVKETFNNKAVLDSVCLTMQTGAPAATDIFLEAPGGNSRILLSSGNGNTTASTYCFNASATENIDGKTGTLTGAYQPEQALDAFHGINPNGTWNIVGFVGGADGTVTSARLTFGVNRSFSWTPTTGLVNANRDTTYAKPTQSLVYKANLNNRFCNTEDSLQLAVLSGNPINVDIAITDPSGPICAGQDVTFEANLSEPLQNLNFNWYVNGVQQTGITGSTFVASGLNNNDQVSVDFSITTVCGNFQDSDMETITVNPFLTPAVGITANQVFPVCEGSSVSFNANATNFGPNPVIEWFVNGASVQSGGQVYNSNGLVNGDSIIVDVSSTYPCLSVNNLRDTIVFETTTELDPKITLVSDANQNSLSCLGKLLTFTADTAFNQSGGRGNLQWFYDGKPITVNSLSTASDTFSVGAHTIRVQYLVNSSCTKASQVSATVSFEIGDEIIPDVSIVSNLNKICAGDSIRFEVVSTVNGGEFPLYQWFKNGKKVPGADSTVFETNDLKNQDEITVRMTSDIECAQFEIDYSEPIVIQVSQLTPTELNITSAQLLEPICKGTRVVATIESQAGQGTAPIYEWFINERRVQRNGLPSLTVDTLKDGDQISAKLISNVICPSPKIAFSDTLNFQVNPVPEFDFASVKVAEGYKFVPSDENFDIYFWDFGNGISSGQTSPTYGFNGPGQYLVCLTATNEFGCASKKCKQVMVTATGITELDASTISLYPNPAENSIRIDGLDPEKNLDLTLIAANGQKIQVPFSFVNKTLVVDLQALASGLYTVKLVVDEGYYTQRFIKN
ncbi:MAG: GEVED domain-containing protein [Luteibaculum sp.]